MAGTEHLDLPQVRDHECADRLVDYLTKRPLYRQQGRASLQYGMYDFKRASLDVTGPLGNATNNIRYTSAEAVSQLRGVAWLVPLKKLVALSDAGVFLAVAAGNDGGDACSGSPSGADGVLAVAAEDRTDMSASFTNYGSCVGVYAPGLSPMDFHALLICSAAFAAALESSKALI